jgi:hypothetical protein
MRFQAVSLALVFVDLCAKLTPVQLPGFGDLSPVRAVESLTCLPPAQEIKFALMLLIGSGASFLGQFPWLETSCSANSSKHQEICATNNFFIALECQFKR